MLTGRSMRTPKQFWVYDAHVLSQDAGLRDGIHQGRVHDHSGCAGWAGGVVMDVTAQRASQQALREANPQLAQILRNSPLPVFVIDAQHRLVVWNPACEYTVWRARQRHAGHYAALVGVLPIRAPVHGRHLA